MPELPDVERFAELTRDHALGRKIVDVEVRSSTIVRGKSAVLRDGLRGRIVVRVERHGKWLFVSTTAPQLIVHFGMTGSLRWTTGAPARADDRVVVRFGNGDLMLSDRRNLATVALAATDEERVAITGPLGPDARALTRADLDRVLDRRRSVKVTMMDQSIVAGLGNMLTDELLWRACLDPSAEQIEVRASHLGMGLNAEVYAELGNALGRFGSDDGRYWAEAA